MLNEYACAIVGTGQRELADCMAKVRLALPTRLGGPNPAGNVPSRVSAIRQGVMPTNTSEPTGATAVTVASPDRALVTARALPVASSFSALVGCQ